MPDIPSTGIDNAEITQTTNHVLDALAKNTIADRMLHSAELSAALSTGKELIELLSGRKVFSQSVVDASKRIGTATAATLSAAYIFS